MKKLVLPVVALFMLCACFSAKPLTSKSLTQYDEHTDYRVDDSRGGFTVTVYYSRYQFFTERYDILAEVEDRVRKIATAYAEKKRRQIRPIDTNRAVISWGRKPMPGITTCHYQVPVEYY